MRDEHPAAGPAAGDGQTGPAPAGRRAGQVTPPPGPPAPAPPTSAQGAPAQATSAQAAPVQRERRRRWLRVAVAILAVGAMAWLIVANRHTLAESLSSLGNLDFRWFALAIVCEAVSLTAFGLSRRRLLRADGHQAGFASVMAITYAGNALSMSVPFAGAQLAAVFSYQQFRRRGLDPALTGWALGISAIASSSALALILIAGAFAGGAPLVTVAGFAAAAVFALPALTVLLALRYPRARQVANKALASLIPLARRVLRKPGLDPAALDEFLTRLASIRLRWPQYAEVFGLAAVNWLADCACLACAIHATGAADPLARPRPRLRRRRRGRQHRGHAGRVRPGRGDPHRRPGGGGPDHGPGADRRARLPADQLLADPARRRHIDDRPQPRPGEPDPPLHPAGTRSRRVRRGG